jgi:hypothetical protein
MGGIGVTRELDPLVLLELQRLLEPLANLDEALLALLGSTGLALVTLDRTSNGSCPKTDTVETAPHVDDHTHDLVVLLILEVLADGCEHDVEPESINVDGLLVLELERPLAAVLVL